MHEHGTTLERNNYLGNITWSAMGLKQNVQAKKVCYLVSSSNLATMGGDYKSGVRPTRGVGKGFQSITNIHVI